MDYREITLGYDKMVLQSESLIKEFFCANCGLFYFGLAGDLCHNKDCCSREKMTDKRYDCESYEFFCFIAENEAFVDEIGWTAKKYVGDFMVENYRKAGVKIKD